MQGATKEEETKFTKFVSGSSTPIQLRAKILVMTVELELTAQKIQKSISSAKRFLAAVAELSKVTHSFVVSK